MKKTMLIWMVLVLCLSLLAGCAAPLNTGSAVSSGNMESLGSSEPPTSSVPASSVPEVSSVPGSVSSGNASEAPEEGDIHLEFDVRILQEKVTDIMYIDRNGCLRFFNSARTRLESQGIEEYSKASAVGRIAGGYFVQRLDGAVEIIRYSSELSDDEVQRMDEYVRRIKNVLESKKMIYVNASEGVTWALTKDFELYQDDALIATGVKYADQNAGILMNGQAIFNGLVVNDPEWTNLVQVAVTPAGIFGLREDGTVLFPKPENMDDYVFAEPRKTIAFIPGTQYAVSAEGEIYALVYSKNGPYFVSQSDVSIPKEILRVYPYIFSDHAVFVGLKADGRFFLPEYEENVFEQNGEQWIWYQSLTDIDTSGYRLQWPESK